MLYGFKSKGWINLILVSMFFVVGVTACGTKRIAVKTDVHYLGVHKHPLNAVLILSKDGPTTDKEYKDSCLGKVIVPAVDELEEGALRACSQNFETVDVVSDKKDSPHHYDVIVEFSDPELNIEGHCGAAVASACAFGIVGAAVSKQSVDVETSFRVTITDRNGRILLSNDFSSTSTQTFGGLESAHAYIGRAVSEALSDALEDMSRHIASSAKIRYYAQAIAGPSDFIALQKPRVPSRVIRPTTLGRYKDGYAVVVGISQYKYVDQGGLTNLVYADDDARAFAGTLKKLGWSDSRVRFLTNKQATKRNVEIALESWLTKAGEEDLIVLFWSGHGYPDPEDPEKVYFACYDTNVHIPSTGYRMDRVRNTLEEHMVRNVVVLADTCHAGKLITRGGEKAISIVPDIEKMRREHRTPRGWIFMVGADSDRLAIENSSWTNGAFTHCLIDALSGRADGFESVGPMDGNVTMGELRTYLNSQMPDETQRVLGVAKRPVITTSTGDPNIWNLSLDRRPAEKHNRLKSEPARFEVEKQLFEKEEDLGENERQRLDNEKQKLAYVQKTVLTPVVSLRSDPKLVLEGHIKKSLKAHNFYDRDLNKHGSFANDFVDNGDGTIADRATGLMWEKGGVSTRRTLPRAKLYVKKLNQNRFTGHSDWRLPTIEELASLVQREKINGVHINPSFDNKQKTCWSADDGLPFGGHSQNPPQIWTVNFATGRITQAVLLSEVGTHYSSSEYNYVRAVRSIK